MNDYDEMLKSQLESCMNFNKILRAALDKHIQELQNIDVMLSFFAIEAQENLGKGQAIMLNEMKKFEKPEGQT